MRFAVAAHLHPTFCVFPSDVLLGCGLVPFTNTSEAFEQFAAFGVTREEMKLMREENGSIAFALSLVGLVKCAVHYASIKELLEHTALMFDAFTAYEARIQTGVGA
ncbi:hypothetical protein BBJ28_00002714 [Nothophytophthora sp. Chile5]|nr:hypothetical protein BBJ28_00002714 [Nothophytophthora sp. Chile5]